MVFDPSDPFENSAPVDWERYQTHSRANDTTGRTHTPLGDPLRWGAIVQQNVKIDGSLPGSFVVRYSEQVIRAQCKDAYSRPWVAIGAVTADRNLVAATAFAFPNAPVATWIPFLEITMGVGQNVTTHNINLRAVAALDQANGVYLDAGLLFSVQSGGLIEPTRQSLPFVITGGLLGNTVNIRVGQLFFTTDEILPPTPGFTGTEQIETHIEIAPFNAGTGL